MLTLNAGAGNYTMGRYTLVDAAAGRTGTFAAFSTNLPSVTRLGYVLGYSADQVYLYLTPNASDTQQEINQNAAALGSLISNDTAALQVGLSYDCTVFDAHNVCVSVGARNTYLSEGALSDQAGLLILAYRPTERTRIGAFADQSYSMGRRAILLSI